MKEQQVDAALQGSTEASGKWSKRGRVALLWTVIALCFGLFNLIYWPLHRAQDRRAPENFLSYAHSVYDAQAPWPSITRLRDGIRTFRPPYPEPYTLIRHYLNEAQALEAGRLRSPYVEFYSAFCAGGLQRVHAFRQAADCAQQVFYLPELPEQTAGYVDALALEFAGICATPSLVESFSPAQKLALLYLSGDAITLGGSIGETGVESPEDILVMSGGGMRAKSGAHIFMRGQDYGSSKRGFHVSLVDPESGQVMQLGVFDLWESEEEAHRMIQFLSAAPEASIAVFAVSDDASVYMIPELEAALLNFGLARKSMENRRPIFFGLRYSFAAIGVKGAAEGTAIQTWSPASFKGYTGHPVVCGVLRSGGGES